MAESDFSMRLEDLSNEQDRKHAAREEQAESIQLYRTRRCLGARRGELASTGRTLDFYDSIAADRPPAKAIR